MGFDTERRATAIVDALDTGEDMAYALLACITDAGLSSGELEIGSGTSGECPSLWWSHIISWRRQAIAFCDVSDADATDTHTYCVRSALRTAWSQGRVAVGLPVFRGELITTARDEKIVELRSAFDRDVASRRLDAFVIGTSNRVPIDASVFAATLYGHALRLKVVVNQAA